MAGDEAFSALGAVGRKFRPFAPTHAEQVLLMELAGRRLVIKAGEELAFSDRAPQFAYVIHEGWACSYKQLADGNRQIIDFRLPGDFLSLISLFLHRPEYNIVTLTDIVASQISTAKLVSVFRQSSLLAEGVFWVLSRDMAIVAEHLVNVGQRDAIARTAHVLIELGYRLHQVGHGKATSYECPLTQKDLAEALGITHVHLNRVLRYLRDRELVSFNGGMVVLHDLTALSRIADFEPSYLSGR